MLLQLNQDKKQGSLYSIYVHTEKNVGYNEHMPLTESMVIQHEPLRKHAYSNV